RRGCPRWPRALLGRIMAGREPFAAVLSALRCCYAEAVPLETFVRQLGDSGAGDAEVVRADDAPGYRTFVGQCLVCVPHGARAIPRPFTFQQLSSQSEVTTRVVQRLCEKKKKNVLTYGYSLPDENSSQFPIVPLSKLYSYLPNTATETLRISGFWETLLSRIGDDVMMYLLEHCAVFMLVPPSNCYQICGQPVYELSSHNVDSFPVFVSQRLSKDKRTSLLKYMQKRLKFHRNYLLKKSYGWKCRQRCEDNVSRMRNERNNEIQSLVSSDQCSAKAVSKASKQIRMVTEHQEKQSSSSSCVSATAPSLKRKIHREKPEIPAKKAKIGEKVREKKAYSLNPDVNPCSSERSETECVAPHSESLIKTPHVSQRSNSAVSRPSLVWSSRGRRKFVAGKSSLLQGVHSNKPLESNTEMQAKSQRKRVEVHTYESQLASGQTKPMAGISSKCRKQASPQPHLSKKLPNRFLSSAVYIERKSLLYCRRSFRECFPKSFLLNRLQGSQAGGRYLVEAIFLSQNPVQQSRNQSLPKHKRRKKTLPKRYCQMRDTFQELLKNHGKCAYLALLRKNCPILIPEIRMRKIELFCQAALPGEAEVQKQAEQFGKEPAKCVTSSRCESGHTDVPDNLGTPLAESVRGELQSEEQNRGEARDSALRELLKQHSSHRHVYLFVRECLDKVIPAELWGSDHNKCRFLKNVKVFISRGKFAKLSLRELMWRMRVNDCVWLRLGKGDHFVPADEHCFREELLAKFLYWLMDTYIAELLRSFFYITETMFQKNMLFYYRKFIWGKLEDIGISRSSWAESHSRIWSMVLGGALDLYIIYIGGDQNVLSLYTENFVFIFEIKINPFPTLKAGFTKERSMNHYNTQLKNLFSVLNYERTINTGFLGSSVFGKDDIYKKWKQFVTEVLESGGEVPHFYCVK
ncbi:TERT transcriptase, partial [Mystacornis crossleyi]|nr:TERT transcriptase [Mystacornis crossleyi]